MKKISKFNKQTVPIEINSQEEPTVIPQKLDPIFIDDSLDDDLLDAIENFENLRKPPLNDDDFEDPYLDMEAIKQWVYPTNLPVRDYQCEIAEQILFQNSLVILPTGLGKTMIASVVMYNYYKWFPACKIIFCAPTKPLVDQQMSACREIMKLSSRVIVEMMGSKSKPETREIEWNEKDIIFCTPQILENDLTEKRINPSNIRLLIFDEAHRATKKHSYCEIVRMVSAANDRVRIIGLTASPGSTLPDIQDVVTNLHISHIEMRSDTDPNIVKYFHKRMEEVVKVPLSTTIENIKFKFEELMQIPLNKLALANITNITNPSKVSVTDVQSWSKKLHSRANSEKWALQTHASLLLLMVQSYGSLIVNGLKEFISSLENIEKHKTMWDKKEFQLIKSQCEQLCLNGIRHPKYDVLKNLLNEKKKTMIFAHKRETVTELKEFLKSDFKVEALMGQKSVDGKKGVTQKEQVKLLEKFKDGKFDILVSTSVGEEGLDIGEVDLIVCFDSLSSLTRTIQRMGRTGRQREGKIVFLTTEGIEEDRYEGNQKKRKDFMKYFELNLKGLTLSTPNRMIPVHPIRVMKELKKSEEKYVKREKNWRKMMNFKFEDHNWLYHQSTTMPISNVKHSSKTNMYLTLLRKCQSDDILSQTQTVPESMDTSMIPIQFTRTSTVKIISRKPPVEEDLVSSPIEVIENSQSPHRDIPDIQYEPIDPIHTEAPPSSPIQLMKSPLKSPLRESPTKSVASPRRLLKQDEYIQGYYITDHRKRKLYITFVKNKNLDREVTN